MRQDANSRNYIIGLIQQNIKIYMRYKPYNLCLYVCVIIFKILLVHIKKKHVYFSYVII